MATGQQRRGVGLDESDPYRYGWRYVREMTPEGKETFRQVPLTELDVLHPQEEDFIVHTEGHNRDLVYLKVGFVAHTRHVSGRRVFCDHRIDFGVEGIEPFGPDLGVFDNVPEWDPERGTFYAAEYNAESRLVVEVTSPSTHRNDVEVKVELYRRCRVPLYVIIDRHAGQDGTGLALWGYRLKPDDSYERVEPGEDGRLWLEAVRLWLSIEDGQAVLTDEQGRRLPPPADLLAQVEEMNARLAAEEEARRLADERIAAMGEAMNLSDAERRQANRRAAEADEARRLAEEGRRQAEAAAAAAEENRRRLEALLQAAQEELRRLKGGGTGPS
jgi:hypothetical protein